MVVCLSANCNVADAAKRIALVNVGTVCEGQSRDVAKVLMLSTASEEATSAQSRTLAAALSQKCSWIRRPISIVSATVSGDLVRIPELVTHASEMRYDVVFAGARAIIRHLKAVNFVGSVVFTTQSDPVVDGFVASFARPGGNMTGFSELVELDEKRLELLKLTLPHIQRVGVLYDNKEWPLTFFERWSAFAIANGMELIRIDATDRKTLELGIGTAKLQRIDAMLIPMSFFAYKDRDWLVAYLSQQKMPAIFERVEFVENGGLMSYGPDGRQTMARVAETVALVLSGVSPSEIPIQRPKDFRLMINLRAARAMNLTTSPSSIKLATDLIR
jgi:putative tryptophan/tyrosine transport system substrate-binding protein